MNEYLNYPQNLAYMENVESWDLINYDDILKYTYAISTFGRVKNIITNHILSTFIINSGYICVHLACDGTKGRKLGNFLVHRLMMITFNPSVNFDEYTVNHHDCIKTNNMYFNLEWMTQKENNDYKYITGTDNSTGEENSNARITNEQAHIICQELEKGTPYKEILRKIGFEPNDCNDTLYDLITNIKMHHSWNNISNQYNFDNIVYNHSNYTDEQIRYICQSLQDGVSLAEMYKVLHNDEYKGSKQNKSFYETVRRIKNRKQFINISKDFNF